jgi:hypothetical protein
MQSAGEDFALQDGRLFDRTLGQQADTTAGNIPNSSPDNLSMGLRKPQE